MGWEQESGIKFVAGRFDSANGGERYHEGQAVEGKDGEAGSGGQLHVRVLIIGNQAQSGLTLHSHGVKIYTCRCCCVRRLIQLSTNSTTHPYAPYPWCNIA